VRTEQSLLEKNGTGFPAVAKKSVLEDYVIYCQLRPRPDGFGYPGLHFIPKAIN